MRGFGIGPARNHLYGHWAKVAKTLWDWLGLVPILCTRWLKMTHPVDTTFGKPSKDRISSGLVPTGPKLRPVCVSWHPSALPDREPVRDDPSHGSATMTEGDAAPGDPAHAHGSARTSAHGSAAAPGGDPADSARATVPRGDDPSGRTCAACGSARIAHGRRPLWCLSCELDAGPVTDRQKDDAAPTRSQDLPEGDAEGRPERIGNAAPVIDDQGGLLVAIPDQTPPARSGWMLPPWPPVVPDSILADPPTPCSNCGRPVICGQPGREAGLCFDCWQGRATQPTPKRRKARR